MKFLTPQETAKLKKILSNYSQFQSTKGQKNFLGVCGLQNYSGRIQSDDPATFVMSIFATLPEVYTTNNNSRRLGLLVFLEYVIADADENLDEEETQFIQEVIAKCKQWEQSKQQQNQKNFQQQSQPSTPRPSVQQPVNKPPTNTRPQPLQPTVTNRPQRAQQAVTNRQKPTAQPVLSVDNAIEIATKTWFILLPIVVIWFFIGANSQSFLDGVADDNQKVFWLIIAGSGGGLSSGLGGWIAWWRVAVARRPIQWEQLFLYSVMGLACGAVCWAIIGYFLSFGGNLREYGQLVGLFFGLAVVIAIFGWLNLKRARR